LARICAARAGSACASTISSKGALHVQHHRVQAAAGLVVDAVDQARRVVERREPIDWASRFGGVDREHADLPAALRRAQPDRARVVVLPTPPEPQQTMILVAGRQ